MNAQFLSGLMSLVGTAVLLALAWLAWRRQGTPGATAFMVLALAVAQMSFFYALEVLSNDLAAQITWGKLQYFGQVATPLVWLIFTLQYSGWESLLTRRNLVLWSVVPAVTLGLVLTNEMHGLVWGSVWLDPESPVPGTRRTHGAWFWVHTAYSYLLLLASVVVLAQVAYQSRGIYRGQAVVLLLASLLPGVGSLLYVVGVGVSRGIDFLALFYFLAIMTMAWALLNRRVLDILPVAYDTVVNGMRDGVLVLDQADHVVTFNPALERLVGRDISGSVGKPLATAFPALASVDNGESHHTEITLNERDVELRVSPLQRREDHHPGRVLVLQDITERKRATVELKQRADELEVLYERVSGLEHLKSDMLQIAAHDLRGPLAIINGYLDLMATQSEELPPDVNGFVSEMQDAVQRMFNILEDLLSLQRIEHMADLDTMAEFNLQGLVEKAMAEYRSQAAKQDQSFRLELPEGPEPTVRGDTTQLYEAITNLIGNAVKYTPSGGEIEVKLSRKEDRVIFTVVDSGYGIPEDQQERLFSPFSRVKTEETHSIEGTGLGLYLVKRIVERHKGRMIFESVYQQGSTFGFTLPAA